MLSLSPRYDLFRFNFPKGFIPEEVHNKWKTILARDAGVIADPLDYLNESIKSITIPGMTDLNITQEQHSYNPIQRDRWRTNVEPNQNNNYMGAFNPLDKITREFTVTFRMNNGLYNYFILYETIFYRVCKNILYEDDDVFYIDFLDEDGTATTRLTLYQCNIDGLDGLDLSYDKVDRQTDTFDIKFKFNNIDFNFIERKDFDNING